MLTSNEALKIQSIVDNFLAEKPKKTVFGNYRIEGVNLIYRTKTLNEKYFSSKTEFAPIRAKIVRGTCQLVDRFKSGLTLEQVDSKIEDSNGARVYWYETEENWIATKVKQDGKLIPIGNSSVLSLVGRTAAYGNVKENRGETTIQRALNSKVIMVPFTVFEQTGLDLMKFKLVERGPESTFKIKGKSEYNPRTGKRFTPVVPRHFTGASLFSVDGKHFLFDVDRKEIRSRIFNPFLVQLPRKVSSIAEAYTSLKPKAVLDAEAKGLKVKRQGEWFFIPCRAPKFKALNDGQKALALLTAWGVYSAAENLGMKSWLKSKLKESQKLIDQVPKRVSLKAGPNRPNEADLGITLNGVTYVKGKIKHSGREHADLLLNDWHIAVPNTATKSVTVTGDVD